MAEPKARVLVIEGEALRTFIVEAVRDALRAAGIREPSGAYLTVVDAAGFASVTPQTIRAWINAGKLTRYRAGRALRVHRDELERLLCDAAAADEAELDPEVRALRDLGLIRR
jgi:excisionase family DNA binding protein